MATTMMMTRMGTDRISEPELKLRYKPFVSRNILPCVPMSSSRHVCTELVFQRTLQCKFSWMDVCCKTKTIENTAVKIPLSDNAGCFIIMIL